MSKRNKKQLTSRFIISSFTALAIFAIIIAVITQYTQKEIVVASNNIVVAKSLGKNHDNLITVGQNENVDYNNIQDAIDNAKDDESNPVTITVDSGIYPRFSLKPRPGVLRYVSIVGVDKKTCIIKDDSGNYLTPPAEICTNGVIKSLTFIATHEKEVWESDKRKSYAIHSDFNTQQLMIEDCILKSYQAPAIGIGLHQNETITLKNCELYSYAELNYGGLYNYGALFCHSAELANTLNQNLVLDECKIYHANSYALRVQNSLLENSKITFTSIKTNTYSGGLGDKCIYMNGITDVEQTPDSFGNYHSEFN